ncbi:MAG: hypothetical protein NTX76_01975 [Alphaproteobacteria bacterium]|nr:hypothetical protein [Alphaproteobacteria bacterium]
MRQRTPLLWQFRRPPPLTTVDDALRNPKIGKAARELIRLGALDPLDALRPMEVLGGLALLGAVNHAYSGAHRIYNEFSKTPDQFYGVVQTAHPTLVKLGYLTLCATAAALPAITAYMMAYINSLPGGQIFNSDFCTWISNNDPSCIVSGGDNSTLPASILNDTLSSVGSAILDVALVTLNGTDTGTNSTGIDTSTYLGITGYNVGGMVRAGFYGVAEMGKYLPGIMATGMGVYRGLKKRGRLDSKLPRR